MDLDYVARYADGVAVLPGWSGSLGARAEVSTALALGLYVAPVERWLSCQAFPDAWDRDRAILADDTRDAATVLARKPGATPTAGDEVRVTSATGGAKGRKLAEIGSVDPLALLRLAEVSGFGAQKYDAFNYLRGFDWSLSYNALQRHLMAFWSGEDSDPESGLSHAGHAAWHCLALLSFAERGLGTDDRFKGAE